MPTIFEAAKTTRNPFTVLGFRAIATSDMLFSMLNFVPKPGEGFEYTREKSIGSFGFISDTFASDIPESTGLDEVVVVPKRQAVSDFYVQMFAQSNQNSPVNPLDRQTVKKFKAAGRTLAEKVIVGKNADGFAIQPFQSGDYVDAVVVGPGLDSLRHGPGEIYYTHSGTLVAFRAPGDRVPGEPVAAATDGIYLLKSDNPSKWILATLDVSDATANAVRQITFTSSTNEFDGLQYLISDSQVRAPKGANGDQATYNILDELIDAVKVWEDNQMAFIMPASLRRKYESLNRGMGGFAPVMLPNGRAAPGYKGVPMLTNDWIPANESVGSADNLSSIYLVNMAPEEGFWMGAMGGQEFDVEADPRNATVLGFQLIDLGPIQKGSGNAVGRRLAYYGAPALGSDLSAARARGIITNG